MKKILVSITVLFLVFTSNVNAKTVTFSEVANKFKEPLSTELNGAEIMIEAIEDNTEVTINNNSIVSTFESDDTKRTVTFNHNNGIITYNYVGSKNDSSAITNSMVDSILISKLIFVISELKGYTIDDLQDIDEDYSKYTLDKNGLEIKMFKYENIADSSSVRIEGYDTIKIDLNKFNLKGNTVSNNTPTNKDEIENPKTGVKDSIIITLLILVTGLVIIKINRKDVIKKI